MTISKWPPMLLTTIAKILTVNQLSHLPVLLAVILIRPIFEASHAEHDQSTGTSAAYV